MWLSWLEHHPVDQKVAGSIPGQGMYPGCDFDPWSGHVREGSWLMFLSHINVSPSPSPSPSPPSFLSLKAMKQMSLSEDKNK